MSAFRRLYGSISLMLLIWADTASAGDVLSQWSPRQFPDSTINNYGLSDILFANGRFVAVGESGDFGAIITSADGMNWTSHSVTNSSITLSVNGIGYGNGRFVGVGWMGVRSLSLDGTNWTQGSIGGNTEYSDVAYGGGQFVAVVTRSQLRP